MSKFKGLVLLLILLVAGWLVYNLPPRPTKLWNEKLPDRHQMSEKQILLNGIVVKYGSNHDGDIDKILLSTADNKVWLHFPPHTARQITAAARINSAIEVTVDRQGVPGHNGEDVFELKYLRSKLAETALDLARIAAPAPKRGIEVELKGIPPKDLNNENDHETNFILTGNLISLPPHMARELLPLMRRAKKIVVKGQMRDTTEGFLSVSGLNVVKPSSIKIDSTTYKVR